MLLHLLRNVVKPQEQTVVFAATKHHVEYLKEVRRGAPAFLSGGVCFHLSLSVNPSVFIHEPPQLLSSEGVDCAYIYSALDQTARKINIGKFVHRKAMVLLVTDVAARGIDIPLLDNVINYNFPSKAKLFLHRVGGFLERTDASTRAGRRGRSSPVVFGPQVVLDVRGAVEQRTVWFVQTRCPSCTTFTSSWDGPSSSPRLNTRKVRFPERQRGPTAASLGPSLLPDSDGVFGRVPQSILDDEGANLTAAHDNSLDLQSLHRISENAYKQYLKSRPNPSPESIKRVKNTDLSCVGVHPLLGPFRGRAHAHTGSRRVEVRPSLTLWSPLRVTFGEKRAGPPPAGGRHQDVQVQIGKIPDECVVGEGETPNTPVFSLQTIFEINSSSKTSACGVMRAKRSKDSQLVNRFSKQREDLAAESRLHQPVSAADEAPSQEDDALQVNDRRHAGIRCFLLKIDRFPVVCKF